MPPLELTFLGVSVTETDDVERPLGQAQPINIKDRP